MSFLARIFPLLGVLRSYKREDLRGDLVAGLTTAVLLIPQSMAYAMLAGLPPIVGLYAATVPAVLYAWLGTSRQLSVGPVAMDSLLVAAGVSAIAQSGTDEYVAYAVLLGLMTGLVQLAMGALRMGFLVNFLSHPVISGFTSAAAIIIGLSQLKHLLGIPLDSSQPAYGLVLEAATRLNEVVPETLAIGALSIATLVVMKKYLPRAPRALVVVVLGSLAVWGLGLASRVAIVGAVPAGLPEPRLPQAPLSVAVELLPVAIAIALVAFMESIAVSKAYARSNRYVVVPNRELVALGAANLAGSLFQGYPVTGGFSRTAVNAQAGARTGVASLITTLAVVVALLFLTPAFYYLPKTVLAGIIFTAVFGLIDFAEVRHLSKVKRSDLILLSLTFFATLGLGIVQGISAGVVVSLIWFVARTTRPHIAVLGRIPGTRQFRNIRRQDGLLTYPGILAVRMDAQFYFGNVSFLRDALAEFETTASAPLRAVVLDFSAINNLDSSALTALVEIQEDYAARDIELHLTTVKGPVLDVIERSGLIEKLGAGAGYRAVADAVDAAVHRLEATGEATRSHPEASDEMPHAEASLDTPPQTQRSLDYVI